MDFGKNEIYGFIAVLCLFVIGVIAMHISHRNWETVSFEEEIPPTQVSENSKPFWLNGRIAFYKKNHYVPSGYTLVTNNCGEYTLYEVLDMNYFESRDIDFELYDLSFPYTISKKANNDTIYVNKYSCQFKFVDLSEPEPEHYMDRFIKYLFSIEE